MSSPAETSKKNHKGIALVALIFAAVVFGLLAGLGGSMLLTHSLIQRPLQAQQNLMTQQHIQYQQQVIALQQQLAAQQELISTLKGELNTFIQADSTGYLKELASIQRENELNSEAMLLQLEQLKKQMEQVDASTEELNKAYDDMKSESDRTTKSIRDDLRMLQSSFNDLETKVQQLERQFSMRN